MGPFATDTDGNTGPWYTNGTFGLTAGWDLDLWGKNRALVKARIGELKAQVAEQAQTRELLSGSVARLYWQWQTEAAIKAVLQQVKNEQNNIVTVDKALYQRGITNSAEGAENDINVSKTDQQLADVTGTMKEIEARLMALTNSQSQSLNLKPASLPTVSAQLPDTLGYELLARRPDLQVAHWYIEASLSEVDAAKAAFYPDINLMAFLQQDALHLSDLFRHSAQQMGVTAGLTLPIFDSGRLNANLDIASAQNSLSIAQYNKAVVDAVNQVAKTASQVETLMAKSQQQQQVEKDAQRVVDLAQARMAAGILPGSRVSMAKLPALQERITALRLHGQWIDASIQLTSALGGHHHHREDQPDPVLQMGVQMMQPRANHLAAEIANGGKQQGPHQRSDNIQRQENARRQAAGADQQGADYPEAIHKAGADDKQPRPVLDHTLRFTDPRFLTGETAQDASPEAATDQIEQLIANHPAEGDGDHHQGKFQ